MTWIFANAILRLAVTIILTIKLARYADMLIKLERLGIGIMGGTSFLTVPVIVNGGSGTPFDGWASTLFTLGALIYFSGRMSRHARHRVNNARMKQAAEAHFHRRRSDPGYGG